MKLSKKKFKPHLRKKKKKRRRRCLCISMNLFVWWVKFMMTSIQIMHNNYLNIAHIFCMALLTVAFFFSLFLFCITIHWCRCCVLSACVTMCTCECCAWLHRIFRSIVKESNSQAEQNINIRFLQIGTATQFVVLLSIC